VTGTRGQDGHKPTFREATEADAAAAARLHADEISEGFLSFLGPGFLTHLYRRISLSPSSFLIVAEADDHVVGFIAGSCDVTALYRSFVWRDGIRASLGVARRLVLGWRRVLETLRHGAGDGAGTGEGTELLAIAVDPSHQGRGIGKGLVDSFLSEVDRTGGSTAYVIVATGNSGAIDLYRRAGFVAAAEFELHAGSRSLLLQWDPVAAGPGGRTPT
jgi:ribosomal protein S18 acetylase RimI-like enzyme